MSTFTLLKLALPVAIFTLIQGCSILPYEEDFACKLKDNLGKCQDVSAAYEEAVTGVSKAPPMKKASEQDDDEDSRDPDIERDDSETAPASPLPTATNQTGYVGYRQAVYSKLQQYVEAPETPMVTPAKTVRTMILPYTTTTDRNRLYMPRYVMSIVNEPKFVMGQYLYKRPELGESIVDQARQEIVK